MVACPLNQSNGGNIVVRTTRQRAVISGVMNVMTPAELGGRGELVWGEFATVSFSGFVTKICVLAKGKTRDFEAVKQLNENGKCPICHKMIPADDVEAHLVMCLTKPRVSYNEDTMKSNNGECVICLEDLLEGETIARLPCLCIYHKACIDQWFVKSQTCPEHPPD